MGLVILLQVCEFSKEIDIAGHTHDPGGIFVIFKWDWIDVLDSKLDQMASTASSTTYTSARSTASHSQSPAPLPASTPPITHTLVFKCIGAVRDGKQQKVLEDAYIARQRGEIVQVKLEPEPDNPYDSQAISFTCRTGPGGVWKRIGYVVRECLEEVHIALTNGDILLVEFAWVKYLLQWSRSGPGFYAGISITRKGQWSHNCIRSASTR